MTDDDDMMDISPHVNLLRSYRGEKIDYVLLVGEGVDNAFDAGANFASVEITPDYIGFEDNGVGITKNRISALFSLGQHAAMPTRSLGRFGIGIKIVAVNAGDLFAIDSTSADGRVQAGVDWNLVLKSGQWKIPIPYWTPVSVDAPKGTKIRISALRKVPDVRLDRIHQEVAERFYPAIAAGHRIVINGHTVERLPDPKLNNYVERSMTLSGDRSVEIRAGILEQPSSRLGGVHVAYGHRVIMPKSATGCADYGGIKRLFARVQLSGRWRLLKLKNGLADQMEIEELNDAVFAVIKPLLEQLDRTTFDARIDEISTRLNELLPEEIAARPIRRKSKSKPGEKGPEKPAGEVKPEKSHPGSGPARTKKPINKVRITLDGNADEDGLGSFEMGYPHRVNLSRDDPLIAELLASRNDDLSARVLLAFALAIYMQEIDQPELALEPFGKRISRLLSIQDIRAAKASA